MAEQIGIRVSDEAKARWDDLRQAYDGNAGDLFEALLADHEAQTLATEHPSHAAALGAFELHVGKIRELMSGMVVTTDALVERARAEASSAARDLEARLADAKALNDSLAEESRGLRDALGDATAARERAEAELGDLSGVRDLLEAERQQVSRLNAQVSAARDELDAARAEARAASESAARAEAKAAGAQSELADARHDLEMSEQRAASAAAEADRLAQASAHNQSLVDALLAQGTSLSADLSRVRAERDGLRDRLADAEERARRLDAELAEARRANDAPQARIDQPQGQEDPA